jgi:DNA processing protein
MSSIAVQYTIMSDKLNTIELDVLPRLREIPAPPTRLSVRGILPPDNHRWLAVVGSRAMSAYGKEVCEYLVRGLRGHPVAIVSGLAYGVDACAHRIALEVGLHCVGVPGSGLDWSVMYPRANVTLARQILEAGGALLSEYEPEQKAADYTFPARNRIMVGLSDAVLLIEAKERSGTLITARLATDYNRELLVVPGSIFSPQSAGAHQFLKLGATPICSPEDVLRALGIDTPAAPEELDLAPHEARIYACLDMPRTRDALSEILTLSASELSSHLSLMEIKGVIREELGAVRRARQ